MQITCTKERRLFALGLWWIGGTTLLALLNETWWRIEFEPAFVATQFAGQGRARPEHIEAFCGHILVNVC